MKKIGLITGLAVATITAHAQNLERNISPQDSQNIPTFTGQNSYAPVPEPTPYLMFGLGALVLAFGRWRSLRSRGPRL